MTDSIEIMAPAGSFESLAAALQSGADSVYFGIGKLNMRSRATVNFTPDDLPEIVRRCHGAGARAYLALNTIIYDSELADMRQLCRAAADAGIDAVIAADVAVMIGARECGLPVHVSVQANVSNLEAVKFYARFAEVLVLARELTLPQIAHIIAAIDHDHICGPSGEKLRIELFAHGALCVSVSGKCYMSLGIYNSSGNRGACFQNCRRAYRVYDEETGAELVIDNKYVMSPKDICTVNILDRLIAAGVRIFKLEGRGRSADYVRTVTAVYREAATAVTAGDFTPARVAQWRERLTTVFNRGFWMGGYYLGEPLGEWTGSGGNRASKNKRHLGQVTKYFARPGVAEVLLGAAGMHAGDEVLITGPTTGAVTLTVAALRVDEQPAEQAVKGNTVTFAVPEKVRANDRVYRLEPRRFGADTPPVNG
ncbi:MAG: U32 family peptidase [Victivallales bacterium]|nr:U32 family peptidase [Victivallales bacterium]